MIRPRLTASAAVLSLFGLACQPRIPNTDTSDDAPPPDIPVSDSLDDAGNCGELGLNCVGPLGIGECVEGACGPQLSGCHWASGSCDSICAVEGGTCQELACDGATAWTWPSGSEQESSDLCAFADVETATPLDVSCDEPLDGEAWYLSCCK